MKQFLILMIPALLLSITNSALAKPELYGSIQYDYQNDSSYVKKRHNFDTHYQAPSQNNRPNQSSKRRSTIGSKDSHIGIKGQKEIGNGNAIIYQWEIGPEDR